jgi:hypothetical protein
LRLTIPVAASTDVMTGNVTNAVLALMDLSSSDQPLIKNDRKRLADALQICRPDQPKDKLVSVA